MFRQGIPQVLPSGVYDKETAEAVKSFQKEFGLPQTGETDPATWDMIVKVYLDYLNSAPAAYHVFPYGNTLPTAATAVRCVHNTGNSDIGRHYDNMPCITVCGEFNSDTLEAVKLFQKQMGLPESGCVDCHTWNMLVHFCEM